MLDCFTDYSAFTGSIGAVPGVVSSYMSVCHNMHIPKDVDIVFVEFRYGIISATYIDR